MCILVQIRIRLVPRPTQNRALLVLADRLTSPPDRPSRHLTDLGKSWPARALTECPPSQRSVRQNQRHLSHACDVVSHTHPTRGRMSAHHSHKTTSSSPLPLSLSFIHVQPTEKRERREEKRRGEGRRREGRGEGGGNPAAGACRRAACR